MTDEAPFLPAWVPADARAAVDDIAAFVDTLAESEVVGSLRCLSNDIARSALRIGLVDPASSRRLREHVATGQLVARILFARLATFHPDTHDHCNGFFDVVARSEARILASGMGGRP